jgi:hypothetical protein
MLSDMCEESERNNEEPSLGIGCRSQLTDEQRADALRAIEASAELRRAWADDLDWTAAHWWLERRVPEDWGGWHESCAPGRGRPEPAEIQSDRARAAAEVLMSIEPEDWCLRCRFCGEPL